MGAFTIPRHGSAPPNIAPGYPPGSKLPGAINVAFYDGHVETVQLEKLWNLSWHRDYLHLRRARNFRACSSLPLRLACGRRPRDQIPSLVSSRAVIVLTDVIDGKWFV
jgi:prepilin-type processing-associated H-X9-DG protein